MCRSEFTGSSSRRFGNFTFRSTMSHSPLLSSSSFYSIVLRCCTLLDQLPILNGEPYTPSSHARWGGQGRVSQGAGESGTTYGVVAHHHGLELCEVIKELVCVTSCCAHSYSLCLCLVSDHLSLSVLASLRSHTTLYISLRRERISTHV